MTLKEQLAASHERAQARLGEAAASGQADSTGSTTEAPRRASVGGGEVTKEKEVCTTTVCR